MDRIKKISMEILEIHKEKFGLDFGENKKTLDDISIIRSKELKNELAGFITKFIKHELREIKENEEREKQAQASEEANEEKLPHGQLPSESEPKSSAEETPPNSEDIKTT